MSMEAFSYQPSAFSKNKDIRETAQNANDEGLYIIWLTADG